MAIVGFSFTKLSGVREIARVNGTLEINHHIRIKDVKKTSFNLSGSKADVLKVDFLLSVDYGANVGKIEIEGDILYSDTKEIIEESIKGFESENKLNPMVHNQIIKFIYTKAIIKALDLSDNLGLPAPIPLPKVEMNSPKKEN